MFTIRKFRKTITKDLVKKLFNAVFIPKNNLLSSPVNHELKGLLVLIKEKLNAFPTGFLLRKQAISSSLS